jgi:hypothetical protein
MAERRAHHLVVVGLAMTASVLSIVVLALQVGTSAAVSKARSAPAASWAAWHQRCGFSHRNNDDPIRFPGEPGRSHDHTYFGNMSTTASSTPASLRASGRTTCGERADKSAYWAPTLFVAGREVEPITTVTRYYGAPTSWSSRSRSG